jgi:hypothetical protein
MKSGGQETRFHARVWHKKKRIHFPSPDRTSNVCLLANAGRFCGLGLSSRPLSLGVGSRGVWGIRQ